MDSNFMATVKVTSGEGAVFAVKVANPEELASALPVAALPTAGETYRNLILRLTTTNKFYVLNTAGDDWDELGAGGSGAVAAEDVSVEATPSNYTAASADVEAHLAGIDSALGSVPEATDLTLVHRNISLVAFKVATTAPLFMENAWVDSFGDQTGIDDSASTGELYDPDGDFYENDTSGEDTEQGSVGTGTYNGAGGANYSVVDKTFKVDNGATVKSISINDNVGATVKLFLGERESASVFDIKVLKEVTTQNTGWQDFELDTPYEVPATGDFYVGAFSASNIYYPSGGTEARIQWNSGPVLGDNGIGAEETGGYIHPMGVVYAVPAEVMSLVTETVVAAADDPDNAEIILRYEDVEAPTPGETLKAYISMNGGSNYEECSTVEEIVTGDSYNVYSFKKTGLTARGANDMRAKIETTASKAIKLHDLAVRWED